MLLLDERKDEENEEYEIKYKDKNLANK